MRIRTVVLSLVTVAFALAGAVDMASAGKAKRGGEYQVAARRPDLPVRQQRPRYVEDQPPELTVYQYRQILNKIGHENINLVEMINKCGGETFCLAGLIKTRENVRDEQRRQELATDLLIGAIAAMLPAAKQYLAEKRDEAAKSGDTEYAGKFGVAVEQVSAASNSYGDLAAYVAKKRQALEAEDSDRKKIPQH